MRTERNVLAINSFVLKKQDQPPQGRRRLVAASTSSTDPAGSVLRPGTIEKDRDATSNPSKTKRAAFYGGLGFTMVEGAVRLMFSGPDTEAAILDETRTDKIQQ